MAAVPYSVLLLVALVVLACVVAFFYTAVLARRHAMYSDRKTCKHCHAVWNATAKFCGKCGKTL